MKLSETLTDLTGALMVEDCVTWLYDYTQCEYTGAGDSQGQLAQSVLIALHTFYFDFI